MKAQTSLEFIVILSAIALFCLSVISAYAHGVSSQGKLLGAVINSTANSSQTYVVAYLEDPEAIINVPVNSTLHKSSTMQVTFYGCRYGNASLDLSSGSVVFSSNRSQTALYDMAILSAQFEPTNPGPNKITVNYTISCENATKTGSASFSTYAQAPPGDSTPAYSAFITNRSEKVSYRLGGASDIINLTEWSHCTWLDFYGTPYPTSYQCGANSWSYMVTSLYCFYNVGVSQTLTVCVSPVKTGYNTTSIALQPAYKYNFSLDLSVGQGQALHSRIGNASNDSKIYLGNEAVGAASVSSVIGETPQQSPVLIGNRGLYAIANQTSYDQYSQSIDALYSKLNYYNATWISGDIQSSIEQAIYAAVRASKALIFSNTTKSGICTVSDGFYTCNATYPFSYLINANISGSVISGDQTLYYLGSRIDMYEK